MKSSHQNDSCITVLGVPGVLLVLLAIRTLPQSRTRADDGERHFTSLRMHVCCFFRGTYLRDLKLLTELIPVGSAAA